MAVEFERGYLKLQQAANNRRGMQSEKKTNVRFEEDCILSFLYLYFNKCHDGNKNKIHQELFFW